MHPCTSTSSSVSSQSGSDSGWSESETFVNVFFGCVAGVGMLMGLLYILDRELFDKSPCAQIKCTCTKHRIDGDYDNDLIDEEYITQDTVEYLAEKQDEEERPKRIVRSLISSVLWRTKEYDEADKYKLSEQPSVGDGDDIATAETDEQHSTIEKKIESAVWNRLEDVRLRFFWRPIESKNENDKYKVTKKRVDRVDDEVIVVEEQEKEDVKWYTTNDEIDWVDASAANAAAKKENDASDDWAPALKVVD